MSKILLVYEDYTEMMSTELTLKKVGFDPIGINSELSISKHVIEFNPDIIIACGKGPKVSSLNIGKKLKEMMRWQGRVVLIFQPNTKPTGNDIAKMRMDLILEAPVKIEKLIQVLAKLTSMDEVALLEKLNKGSAPDSREFTYVRGSHHESEESTYVGGGNFTIQPENQIIKGGTEFKMKGNIAPGSETIPGNPASQSTPSSKKDEAAAFELEIQRLMGKKDPAKNDQIKIENEKLNEVTEIKGGNIAGENQDGNQTQGTHRDIKQEMLQAQTHDRERVSNYDKLVKGIQLNPQSSLTRKKTRKAQMEILKDTTEEKLLAQDELRREFTRSLFKKNA